MQFGLGFGPSGDHHGYKLTIMPCDPNTLIEQAKCLNACIPQGMLPAVNVSLLCNIASAGGGAVFPSGLTHYWTLNEASGNSRVDSIGALNLLESNGAVASAAGINGNAANLTGTPTRVLTNAAGINLAGDYSIAVWINPTLAAVNLLGATVFDFTDSSGPGTNNVNLSVVEDTPGTLVANSKLGDDNIISTTPSTLSIGTWNLIVITISGNTGTIYLNGLLKISDTSTTTHPNGTFKIGFINFTLDGLVDAWMIFNRAITPSEVTSLWNGGVGLFP